MIVGNLQIDVSPERIADGALLDQWSEGLSLVIQNIADARTAASASRKIVITTTVKPTDSRDLLQVAIQTKVMLAPTSKATRIDLELDEAGDIIATEDIPDEMEQRDLPGMIGEEDGPKVPFTMLRKPKEE